MQSDMPQPLTIADIIKERVQPNARQEGGTHYKEMGVEPWDVLDTWPIEQQIGFHRGNVLKYVMRLGSKDVCLQEAKKIRHYTDKLIQVLEKQNGL